jgi:hypothetical protein
MRIWTEDSEDWSVELERLIDAGDDRVVGLFHQRGIGKGSGAPVELHQGLVYELERGRVIRMRNYIDPAEALEAAGLSSRRCRRRTSSCSTGGMMPSTGATPMPSSNFATQTGSSTRASGVGGRWPLPRSWGRPEMVGEPHRRHPQPARED